MPQTVLKLDPTIIEKMKHHYHSYLLEKIPQGGIFSAKVADCTITAYASGKVLFQGNAAENEANKWSHEAITPTTKNTPSTPKKTIGKFSPSNNISSLSIIGSDEVGTGDYFGPMMVVATYVDKKHLLLVKELGVKDSKNLTDQQITAIAQKLIHIIPYSLLILHNEKYNQLQKSGMSQGKMKALLHNQAISNVIEKIKPIQPEGILIDQFAQPDIYFNYLKEQKLVIRDNVFFSTKGEQAHLAVAAASIIARYAFIKEFEKLSESVGITLPKGAGSKVDVTAAKIINQYGMQFLLKCAKVHFANTEKALKLTK